MTFSDRTPVFLGADFGSNSRQVLTMARREGKSYRMDLMLLVRDHAMDDIDRMLRGFHRLDRCAFANLGELEDAARRGQERAERLAAFDVRPDPVAPKPVVARVAGADIRRFLPRRAV